MIRTILKAGAMWLGMALILFHICYWYSILYSIGIDSIVFTVKVISSMYMGTIYMVPTGAVLVYIWYKLKKEGL